MVFNNVSRRKKKGPFVSVKRFYHVHCSLTEQSTISTVCLHLRHNVIPFSSEYHKDENETKQYEQEPFTKVRVRKRSVVQVQQRCPPGDATLPNSLEDLSTS